jgi:hypothetical protein
MLKHSQARRIAEAEWGRHGTTSYGTNRAGAFYFSCSGHGGFVIDGAAFTQDEVAKLAGYGFKPESCFAVVDTEDELVGIAAPATLGPSRLRYRPGLGERTVTSYPVYTFEEDCDWSAVYVLTGVRLKRDLKRPEAENAAKGCFTRWIEARTGNG